MKFLAKATGLNGVTVWEGFYAEIKREDGKIPVIIDLVEGTPHEIMPSTLKWHTGIQTIKAQPIYEGDKVEVWNDLDSVIGVVEWSVVNAGWVVKDFHGILHDLVGTDRCFAK